MRGPAYFVNRPDSPACVLDDGQPPPDLIGATMGAMNKTAALLALAFVLILAPANAISAPLDTAADHTALIAYHQYLTALVDRLGAGRLSDLGLVESVRARCGRVLAPLKSTPGSQVSQSALRDFGEEIGGDLAVEFHAEAMSAFTRLSTTLDGLRWSSSRTTSTVSALVDAIHASLEVSVSSLCADARALAAHPGTVPPGTSAFLAAYLPATELAKQRLAPFLSVLERFQTPREAREIGSIDRLVSQFNATSTTVENADSVKIVAALGLASS